MGSLSEVIIPVEDVPISGGQTLTVRGLAYLDFGIIYEKHTTSAEEIAKIFVETKDGEMPPFDAIVKKLVTEFPEVAAEVIAIANDEPENITTARRLPAVVQTRALLAVTRLTLHSRAEVKKIVTDIMLGLMAADEIRWMPIDQTVSELLTDQPDTEAGSGESESSLASS